MSDLTLILCTAVLGMAIILAGADRNHWLRKINRTLELIQFALEDQIKADMEHAEPECQRCGAECVNPECQREVNEQ